MLIPKGYILSNEIADKGGIHIANFSTFVKKVEDANIKDAVLKYGNCTFINIYSDYIPKAFLKITGQNKMTPMDDKVLTSFVKSEFKCTLKEFLRIPGSKEVKVQGKSFIQLPLEFINTVKDKVLTNINKRDYNDCDLNDDIDGAVKLSNDNYLVWY